jgi:hypothetical protein
MDDNGGFDPDKILEDGVITGCTLRNLSESIEREEQEERVLNGSLSMVCTYPEVDITRCFIYFPHAF